MKHFYVVEKLRFFNWFFQIWPRLFGKKGVKIYCIDSSTFIFKLVRWMGALFQFQLERFCFHLVEVKDDTGLLIRIRLPCQDLLEIQPEILEKPVFKDLYHLKEKDDRWPMYVAKMAQVFGLTSRTLLSRSLFLIQVTLWQAKKESCDSPTLFLNRAAWQEILFEYGKRQNVYVCFVRPGFSLDLRRLPWPWLKRLYYTLLYGRWCLKQKQFPFLKKKSRKAQRNGNSKIAIEYYGCFNLDDPSRYSDFFFCQQSGLSYQDLSAFFRIPGDPLDEKKHASLKAKGIEGVVLDPRASCLPQVPPYLPKMKELKRNRVTVPFRHLALNGLEKRWVKEISVQYEWLYHWWREVFKNYQTKIYTSWYKYDADHCPIGAAIRDLGGVLAIYQRALDVIPFIETQLHCDLYFSYSQMMVNLERKIASKIPYMVITGYLGDHRFSLLKGQAKKVRDQLSASGAKYIVAYTDENSGNDSRWHTGHEFMRVNYAFLLEKLIQNSWMGLVLKPKVPITLRRRLGEVAPLLREALKTGRCFLYEEGPIQGAYPPAVAALSADIAIHGHLCAPTAALEAALAGVPTLLMDREGCPISPLYQLGEGRVVFKDWETLWAACLDHRQTKSKDHSIGSWAPMIDQLDPFRDGKAANRMGTYLKWLIEGFKAGQEREKVLADAAERYQTIWGKDKVISIS